MLRRVIPLFSLQKLLMPALSPSMEEGTIVEWLKKPGDLVAPGDIYLRLQTDKAVVDYVNSADEGYLAKILQQNGDVVQVGGVIGVLADDKSEISGADAYAASLVSAKPAAAAAPAAPTPAPAAAPAAPAPAATAAAVATAGSGDLSRSGPAAQRLAAALADSELKQVVPTGKDGRYTKADMLAAFPRLAEAAAPAPAAARAANAPAKAATVSNNASGEFDVRPGRVFATNVRDDTVLSKLIQNSAKPSKKKVAA